MVSFRSAETFGGDKTIGTSAYDSQGERGDLPTQSLEPRRFDLVELVCRFSALARIAQGLADEDKKKKGEAGSKRGQHGNEWFLGLGFELW